MDFVIVFSIIHLYSSIQFSIVYRRYVHRFNDFFIVAFQFSKVYFNYTILFSMVYLASPARGFFYEIQWFTCLSVRSLNFQRCKIMTFFFQLWLFLSQKSSFQFRFCWFSTISSNRAFCFRAIISPEGAETKIHPIHPLYWRNPTPLPSPIRNGTIRVSGVESSRISIWKLTWKSANA
jgi:hypothetical protein